MSTKFTKSQIKKIIKEELENILLEIAMSSVGDALEFFAKWAKKAGRASAQRANDALGLLAQKSDLTAADLTDARRVLNKIPATDPLKNSLEEVYKDLAKKAGLDDVVPDAATVTKAASSGGSNLGAKTAATVGATGAAVGLATMSDDEAFQSADASQFGHPDLLMSMEPEDLQSLPPEEYVNNDWDIFNLMKKLSPEKQKIVKQKLESAKARRTRIAHATIKGTNRAESIKIIQKRLKNLGYDLGTFGPRGDGIDGDYGDTTVKAVKAFQESNGLTGDQADGIVGNTTWKLLRSENAKGPSASVASSPASPSVSAQGALPANVASLTDYRTIFRLYTKFKNQLNRRAISANRAAPKSLSGNELSLVLSSFLPTQGQIGVGPGRTGETGKQAGSKMLKQIEKVLVSGIARLVSPIEAKKDLNTAIFNDPELKKALANAPASLTTTGEEEKVDIKELEESKRYDLSFNKWSKLWE